MAEGKNTTEASKLSASIDSGAEIASEALAKANDLQIREIGKGIRTKMKHLEASKNNIPTELYAKQMNALMKTATKLFYIRK